jgi:hypothetical protein
VPLGLPFPHATLKVGRIGAVREIVFQFARLSVIDPIEKIGYPAFHLSTPFHPASNAAMRGMGKIYPFSSLKASRKTSFSAISVATQYAGQNTGFQAPWWTRGTPGINIQTNKCVDSNNLDHLGKHDAVFSLAALGLG